MAKIKAVFFDAGHTLIYAHPSIGDIYARITAEFGAAVSAETFTKEFSAVFHEFVQQYNHAMSSDEQDVMMWREITRRIFQRVPEMQGIAFDAWFERTYGFFGRAEAWRFYEDVERTLRALRRRGFQLGVVSNWDTRLKNITREMGLDRMVDFVLISAEVGFRKPDPRIFARALELAHVKPEAVLHVGDVYEEDVLGAKASGLHYILLDRRGRYQDKKDAVPVIAGLDELLSFVD